MNFDPRQAFVGTKSHKVLMGWIERMDILASYLENSHTEECLENIKSIANHWKVPVVALGNKASDRLTKMGIEHFKLPHPSGRNRKLNDPKFVDSELEKCKNYLRGKAKCA